MKPKMSLMVGTKMTSKLLKARMPAAITMWRIQLNSRPLNSSVMMEERIWVRTQSTDISDSGLIVHIQTNMFSTCN